MPVFSFAQFQKDKYRCSQEEHVILDVDQELYLCKGLKRGQEGAEGNGIGETITIGFQNPQKVSCLEFC